jgi:putative sigma-54 modulation protein
MTAWPCGPGPAAGPNRKGDPMQLQLHPRGLHLGRGLKSRILDHAEASLNRFAKRIRGITICLADVKGPRGGVDKVCQVAVLLNRGATIRSCRTDASLSAAVSRALDRATQAVVRRLERQRKRAARPRRRSLRRA